MCREQVIAGLTQIVLGRAVIEYSARSGSDRNVRVFVERKHIKGI